MTKFIDSPPKLIEGENLSVVWAKVMLQILDNAGTKIAPLALSFNEFDERTIPNEDDEIRSELDGLLVKKNKTSIDNVAFTIFPQSYWLISNQNRNELYDLYSKSFERIKNTNRVLNGRGLYFQRLVMFGSGPCNGNQLEWIISQHNGRRGVRHSMFHASIFDVSKDHVPQAQLGFPCLQNISFVPTETGLVMNAFYATQQIFDKAYGNYLGLIQLAAFMAGEMEMRLARVNIYIGVAKFERITKGDPDLARLIELARKAVAEDEVRIK